MLETDVQTTLARHGYRCSLDGDRQYLISWLELLILLRRLQLSISTVRTVMDDMTWPDRVETQHYPRVVVKRVKGTLVVDGFVHTFTPFPR